MSKARVVVAIEGKQYADGRIIMPGAIKCTDDKIPVSSNFDWSNIVGVASNMERNEETGEITMEIEFGDPIFKPERDTYEANVSLSDIDVDKTDGAFEVKDGRLRGVSIRHNP